LDAASGQHYHLSTLLGMLLRSGKEQKRVPTSDDSFTTVIGYGKYIREPNAQVTGGR